MSELISVQLELSEVRQQHAKINDSIAAVQDNIDAVQDNIVIIQKQIKELSRCNLKVFIALQRAEYRLHDLKVAEPSKQKSEDANTFVESFKQRLLAKQQIHDTQLSDASSNEATEEKGTIIKEGQADDK